MIKFNSNHLFVGYIKQLLHDFNLPKFKVYTKQNAAYYKKTGREQNIIESIVRNNDILDLKDTTANIKASYPTNMIYVPYIKDNKIMEYINGEWQAVGDYILNDGVKGGDELDRHIHFYNYNASYLNYTKNLIIRDSAYDSYTHEYLGDYLRFLRDYNNLDLMPLYNCFSNNSCPKLKINTVKFDTNDSNYKIYMVPVKLFQKYTIAIDSALPIELCCGIYDEIQDTRKCFNDLPTLTYKKFPATIFSQPIIYDKILNLTTAKIKSTKKDLYDALVQVEDELKLFIKIPAENTSTIVILEGDYTKWNNKITKVQTTAAGVSRPQIKANRTVVNLDHKAQYEDMPLITSLQLLQFNTNQQIPFADRLIEYLTGNVITSLEENADNIERVQTVMAVNMSNPDHSVLYDPEFKNQGVWTDGLRVIAYDYMQNHYKDYITNRDCFGYIDKDIEKNYSYKSQALGSQTISGVDIYEDSYYERMTKYGL